jgi:hypothetical protein
MKSAECAATRQRSGGPSTTYFDKPQRHAEILSILPGVSCQSFLRVDNDDDSGLPATAYSLSRCLAR